MLLYGVHIGHSFYIVGFIVVDYLYLLPKYIIYKFIKDMEKLTISSARFRWSYIYRQPVWFVNFDATTDHFIKYSAVNCADIILLLIEYMVWHQIMCHF